MNNGSKKLNVIKECAERGDLSNVQSDWLLCIGNMRALMTCRQVSNGDTGDRQIVIKECAEGKWGVNSWANTILSGRC